MAGWWGGRSTMRVTGGAGFDDNHTPDEPDTDWKRSAPDRTDHRNIVRNYAPGARWRQSAGDRSHRERTPGRKSQGVGRSGLFFIRRTDTPGAAIILVTLRRLSVRNPEIIGCRSQFARFDDPRRHWAGLKSRGSKQANWIDTQYLGFRTR